MLRNLGSWEILRYKSIINQKPITNNQKPYTTTHNQQLWTTGSATINENEDEDKSISLLIMYNFSVY